MLTLEWFLPGGKTAEHEVFSPLSERDTDFLIGQSHQDEQTESRDIVMCRGTSSDNISNPTQVNYPQVDVHTLEENIVSKVRSEMDNVTASVETRIPDAVLTAIENLVIPRVEFVMMSANAPSVLSVMYWPLIRRIFWVILTAYE